MWRGATATCRCVAINFEDSICRGSGSDVTLARILGIDHVQLAIPAGGEARARAFYVDLLGLREVPKPPALAARGGCWFAGDDVAIHLGVEEPFRAATKAHVALVVEDLDGVRERLTGAGVETASDDAGIDVCRFYAFDPFGNRLELIDADDRGFSARTVGASG